MFSPAIVDEQVAFFVEKSRVAGVDPAVDERLRRGRGLPPVADHVRGRADADLPRGARGEFATRGIDAALRDARIRPTRGTQAIVVFARDR